MNRLYFYFMSLIMLLGLWEPVPSQQENENSLPEVIKLLTGTWVGYGTDEEGGKFESHLVFEPMLNGNFLKATNYIMVDGAEQKYAETTYGWQPVLGHLVFWSFDKEGAINEGFAEWTGSVLKHEWRSFSAGGEIGDWRSELQLNKNELTFVMYDGKNTAIIVNKLIYKKE